MAKGEKVKFNPAQYRELERVFPKVPIDPSTSIETIMYNAGIQRVLEYVLKNNQAPREVIINDTDNPR